MMLHQVSHLRAYRSRTNRKKILLSINFNSIFFNLIHQQSSTNDHSLSNDRETMESCTGIKKIGMCSRSPGCQKNNFHCTVFEISFCTSILNHVFSLRQTTFHTQNDGKMTTQGVWTKPSRFPTTPGSSFHFHPDFCKIFPAFAIFLQLISILK